MPTAQLGTQMKATGEVMSIGTSFEQAMMKAVRSIELKLDTFNLPKLQMLNDSDVVRLLKRCDDERVFVVYEALKRGIEIAKIHNITKIDEVVPGQIAKSGQDGTEAGEKGTNARIVFRSQENGLFGQNHRTAFR